MHRTATRPAPLDFPLSSTYPTYSVDKLRTLDHSPSKHTPVYFQAPVKAGLHTPPEDEMGTTYQHPQYNPYASRPDSTYSNSATVTTGRSYGGFPTVRQCAVPHPHSTLNQLSAPTASLLRNENQISQQSYRQPTSPLSSTRSTTLAPEEEPSPRPSSRNDLILASLQIPSSINNSGGSLAEFAAQITCLFWFESTETLKKAENVGISSGTINRLRDEALPSSGFKKWVVTILSTTQVTQNVILLALLFIYRLKKINPAVKGRSGSEYRLLTVALMLGNKFLDDNTYTNKTWAEVSGISVTEIHVMEVEFLSNMRYSLLASKEQWQEWQEKLGKFWIYCDEAAKAPVLQISPHAHAVLPPALPSPPSSMQNSPPSLTSGYRKWEPEPGASSSNSTGSHYSQQWPANYGATVSTHAPTMPEHDLGSSARKRSYEGNLEQPATKRVTRPAPNGVAASFPSATPPRRNELPRLPVPNLTISTSQPMSSYNNPSSALSQIVPLLPPLSGSRSMASVFPATPSWPPNLHVLTPTGPPSQHGTPNGNGYSTPSRRTSPRSVQDLLSLGSSPVSGNFPGHNPGHISPSFFLQQRNSPYKPVRHVNTLLYPPPSASMHGYSANVDQMHYQPLGRRNDYRPGVVPEYASQGPYQQWPVLPQPNFHA
ncbi:hypothetical protein HYALB_00006450 [Hymenoscyphus albidus]|uniref:Cyclin-like protein n=1 Tax=Hymenoscyphus albidus TaxID=595503 RepID=A0A9N9Q350_9HELO|nr:hypothetical protein HYALB_00006450 [Hymenoscyphus albidus]